MLRGHMLKVGPFVFAASTAAYEKMTRTDNWRWVTVERVGNELANQYMGPGERTISLTGMVFTLYDAGAAPFNPRAVVGTEQVAKLRSAGDGGAPVIVTDGRGQTFGRWVILSVSETGSVFMDHGAAKKQEFTLDLRYYGGGSGRSGTGLVMSGILNNVLTGVQGLTGNTVGVTIEPRALITSAMRNAGVDLP